MTNHNNSEFMNGPQVGEKFLCIKDVYMNTTNDIAYKKGKVYECVNTNCLTDEIGNTNHFWFKGDYFNQLFTPVLEHETGTEPSPQSTVQCNKQPVKSFNELKKGDKVWHIKKDGNWDINEFVDILPNTNGKYAVFLNMHHDGLPKKYYKDFENESWFRYYETPECWMHIFDDVVEFYKEGLKKAEEIAKHHREKL
jgi:hypothetical protein